MFSCAQLKQSLLCLWERVFPISAAEVATLTSSVLILSRPSKPPSSMGRFGRAVKLVMGRRRSTATTVALCNNSWKLHGPVTLSLTNNQLLKWLSSLHILRQNHSCGDSVALGIVPTDLPPHPPPPTPHTHTYTSGWDLGPDEYLSGGNWAR